MFGSLRVVVAPAEFSAGSRFFYFYITNSEFRNHAEISTQITQERPMVTLQLRVSSESGGADHPGHVKQRLAERFRGTHATVEAEFNGCADQTATERG